MQRIHTFASIVNKSIIMWIPMIQRLLKLTHSSTYISRLLNSWSHFLNEIPFYESLENRKPRKNQMLSHLFFSKLSNMRLEFNLMYTLIRSEKDIFFNPILPVNFLTCSFHIYKGMAEEYAFAKILLPSIKMIASEIRNFNFICTEWYLV